MYIRVGCDSCEGEGEGDIVGSAVGIELVGVDVVGAFVVGAVVGFDVVVGVLVGVDVVGAAEVGLAVGGSAVNLNSLNQQYLTPFTPESMDWTRMCMLLGSVGLHAVKLPDMSTF